MNLASRHVVVLGAARSGRAAAALALREGARVTVLDTSPAARLEGLGGVELLVGEAARADTRTYDLLVTSPGVDLAAGWGRDVAARCPQAIGETELAARFFRGRMVGITGTNGKTTTTEMVAGLLAASGLRCLASGNYGLPLSEVVLDHPDTDAVALELSSFQLETVDELRLDVAVWLNFAPDHLDRYPSVAAYRAAKERIFRNLGPAQTAVVPAQEHALAVRSGARVRTFSVDDPAADFHLDGRKVVRDGQAVLDLDAVAVRGRHNHANLMAAWAAVEPLGAGDDAARRFFATYRPPHHRFEWVRSLDGVDYVNDSKSTNLHSLETALVAEDRPVVLIAGGKEKGLDFRPLAPLVAARCRAVVAIGEIAPALVAVWGGPVAVTPAPTLEDAVACARALARPGDMVLLSPGTSSFDWFRNYEHRGERFAAIVDSLT